ncbi:LPPG:FO 2-phospho-L-lactate transferase [Halopenitus malekzadehii]|uniref:2-phospho-L-lactate transferase n=1 Tax=Halopenitus malekzadehii TaxID=1267564 RepID=A0A1H6IH25_9EURY|nr:2-phospho-L-lactate transferase CofD family protein [Halopenitus malekzadehii]SEH47817.1 LPPG:FO 2-phospho-L-lactate transferase [Halopenitus malekzadehii]
MVTFLAGGTGTPKLLQGATTVWDAASITVVGNTGDDVEIGGHLVCPDIDTVLFWGGDVLDRETWWGIDNDTTATHEELSRIASAAGLEDGPRYLPDDAQTAGRRIANWRRFSGVAEFLEIGDRDRAVHITRTGLLDEGRSLTEVTRTLADAFGLAVDLVPMSDDPVATIVHTDDGPLHFQEYWVDRRADPAVEAVEFRGTDPDPSTQISTRQTTPTQTTPTQTTPTQTTTTQATPTQTTPTQTTQATPTRAVEEALTEPVVIGPSNPVTSIGPMLALPGVEAALQETPVVAVSPFVEDVVFSGPAAELMAGVGIDPSTAGVAAAYPFADAFVLDADDGTDLDREVVRTNTRIENAADAERVARACQSALAAVR